MGFNVFHVFVLIIIASPECVLVVCLFPQLTDHSLLAYRCIRSFDRNVVFDDIRE